jgi:hypothetical protein
MRIRFHFIQYPCAFLLFFVLTAHAALKTDTWTGGTGIWNNASNWSLHVVPHNNNGSNDQYIVDIDGGNLAASAVVIDQSLNPIVNAVALDANDSLTITNGVTFTTTNGATFNGTVTLAGANFGATLQFTGTATLGGNGKVVYGGLFPFNDRIQAPSGTLTISPGITIYGAGGLLQGSPNGPVINQGTICTDTSNQTMNLNYVINQGQLIASNGSDFYLSPFTNSGTISVTGGTLTLDTSWSNSGTISGNVSFIELNGNFTTPGGSFVNVGSTITINGTMLNTGNTFALTPTTGSWYLNGTISGGTITASGGAQLIADNGVLDGVTINGPLNVTNGATLSVTSNGLTLNSTLTLASANNGANLQFNGVSTLGGTGEVVYGGLFPNNDRVLAPSGTLTIGPGITIYGAGGLLQGSPSAPIINQGTLYTDTSNQTMNLNYLINQGQLIASNGSDFYLFAVTNSGTVSITGGTLTLDSSWANSGVVSGNLSFIELDGTFATPGGNFVNVGSTININGTMVNTAGTLALTPTTGSWYLNGGTIQGGTITGSGGAQLIVRNGIMDGVTLNDPLTVTNGATLSVTSNGLTLNSTLTLDGDSFGANLQFNGTATLGGTGEVVYGGLFPINDRVFAPSGTLTIGPGITIHGAGGLLEGSASAPVINQGTVYTDTSNQTLNLYYVVNQGQLIASNGSDLYLFSSTNSGTVSITGGTLTLDSSWANSGVVSGNLSLIELNGAFTTPGGSLVNVGSTININGTMLNTANTLALTPTTGSWYLNGGAIQGGTITASGGAQLLVNSGTLDGVTLNGPLNVTNGATLSVTSNGLTLNSTLTLNGDNFGANLLFNGTATLGGTGEVVYGGLFPINDRVFAPSGTLTIGPGITIQTAGGTVQGSPAGPVINQGTIYTDTSNQTLNLYYVVNQGQLIASNGSDLNLNPFSNQGQLLALNSSTLFAYYLTNSGVVSIDNTSTLQFTGDYVQTGGSTVLDGGQLIPITGGSILVDGGNLDGGAFLTMAVTNFGTINPGPAASAFVFANNLVLQSSSVIDFQVGGYTPVSQYGYIVLSNGVNLAGSFAVTLINGFVPAPGSSLTVLTSGALITGGFTNVVPGFRIPTTDGAGSFVFSQTPNTIALDDFQIDPQPYLTWAQSFFGCTNCPQSSELADPAGDGMNNLAKFLAGFNPTNSTAYPHIISITRTNGNTDILVTYLGANGDSSLVSGMQSRTNVLEYSTGEADGSYSTTNFVSTGQTNILSGGNGMGIVTNMVDPGGATNQPVRYYRIKIITP